MKITKEQWEYIGKFNYARPSLRRFCTYTLIKEDNVVYIREQKLNLLFYILLFIPFNIIQLLMCMWDGGLKEFEVIDRNLGKDRLVYSSPSWLRADEIFNKETNIGAGILYKKEHR